MGASEGAPPVPVAGEAGYFTQKEAAVVAALMDYLGIERMTPREGVEILTFVRTLHDKCRTV